jgi:ABC-type multidrug transport system fused ATPase/permease subunit
MSVVQYQGQSISMFDVNLDTVVSALTPVVTDQSTYYFDAESIGFDFLYLFYMSLTYLFLAWFFGQVLPLEGSEGRPIETVLFPSFIRKMFEQKIIFQGDIHSELKERSRTDGSVIAQKVSKTYSGVQALKEVSFTMKKGEVFVMLGHNGAGKSK